MTAADQFIEQYAKEYLGKVFYFCLKKTGDPQNAENLTSEISASVLSQLRKGRSPHAASIDMCDLLMMTVNDLVASGGLIVPATPEKSTLSMCWNYRKTKTGDSFRVVSAR